VRIKSEGSRPQAEKNFSVETRWKSGLQFTIGGAQQAGHCAGSRSATADMLHVAMYVCRARRFRFFQLFFVGDFESLSSPCFSIRIGGVGHTLIAIERAASGLTCLYKGPSFRIGPRRCRRQTLSQSSWWPERRVDGQTRPLFGSAARIYDDTCSGNRNPIIHKFWRRAGRHVLRIQRGLISGTGFEDESSVLRRKPVYSMRNARTAVVEAVAVLAGRPTGGPKMNPPRVDVIRRSFLRLDRRVRNFCYR